MFHLELDCEREPSMAFVAAGGHFHLRLETVDVDAAAAELKAKGVTLAGRREGGRGGGKREAGSGKRVRQRHALVIHDVRTGDQRPWVPAFAGTTVVGCIVTPRDAMARRVELPDRCGGPRSADAERSPSSPRKRGIHGR